MVDHTLDPGFNVYAKEPLVRTIARTNLHPAVLGVLFFLTVSLSLIIWAAISTTDKHPTGFITYFDNISWSVSMLLLFPTLVGITFKYYQDIPELFRDLLSQTTANCPINKKLAFRESIAQRFANPFAPLVIGLITLPLNYFYFFQDVTQYPGKSWLTDGNYLSILFFPKTGLSAMGVYAAIIQVTLLYWVVNVLWNTYVFTVCLNGFFTEFSDEISLEPLHPDGCCGLRRIRAVSMVFSSLLFIIGLYVSLKVIDKLVIQERSLFSDIGNPLFLSAYAIAAPLLFFLPLSAAHKVMQREKDRFLIPISRRYQQAVESLREDTKKDEFERVEKLGSLYYELHKRIPVWPFDFRSLQAFFAAVIVPVLPVLLPLAVHLIQGLARK